MKRYRLISRTLSRKDRPMTTEQADATTTCKYPGCENVPARASGQPGRPPEYCEDAGHNRVTAWRERRRLDAEQHGAVTTDAGTEQPVTMARVTGAELLRSLRAEADRVSGIAERLREAIATVGNPTAAEVELEAMRTAAEQRAATAEARAAAAEQRAATADQLRAQA